MRLLTRVLAFVAVLIVGLVGIGFLLSEEVHVERQAAIDAPPAVVFAILNNFKDFDQWSPWADRDPAMKVERSGPESGVGAKYVWSGNREVGSGSQEITASTPDSEIRIKLIFGDWDTPSEAVYRIAPDGSGSVVTWALDSHLGSNPVNRYFGLFMDKQVGPDYVLGLSRLKTLAEAKAKEVPPSPAESAPAEVSPVAEPAPAADGTASATPAS